jgi:hypothetical protein
MISLCLSGYIAASQFLILMLLSAIILDISVPITIIL